MMQPVAVHAREELASRVEAALSEAGLFGARLGAEEAPAGALVLEAAWPDASEVLARWAGAGMPVVLAVAADPRRGDHAVWYPDFDRCVLSLRADAYVWEGRGVAQAVRYVLGEDRGGRELGAPRLVCLGAHDGAMIGRAYPLIDTLTMGRGRTADVRTPSGAVARLHARLLRTGSDLLLQDLKGTNGTCVLHADGRITFLDIADFTPALGQVPGFHRSTAGSVVLRPGDEIALPSFFRFRVDGALAAAG